jgi:plastocyanin
VRLAAAGVAALVLLGLPSAVAAHPGHGPEQVLVGRGAFTAPKVTVGVDDTVLWLWSGPDTRHSITADPGQAESFDSDPDGLAEHRTFDAFSHRFTRLGRFTYHCRIHPDTMRGEVEVVPLPPEDSTTPALGRVVVRPARMRLVFTSTERVTVLARVEWRSHGRWRTKRDFDIAARRGRNEARMPLRGLDPGRYRVRLTAYDAADNRSRTVTRRFRLG